MRIEQAELYAKKLLQFANERAATPTAVYENTKERISKIIDICDQANAILSQIVDDYSYRDIDTPNPKPVDKPTKYKNIVSTYAKILNQPDVINHRIPAVRDCAKLIQTWFDVRILKNRTYTEFPLFKCDYRRFKRIIYSLVIMYGYHFEHNSVPICQQQFDEWVSELGKSQKITTQCATPWQAYQIEIQDDPQYANLTAVVIWDVLMDTSLKQLCDKRIVEDSCLSESGVWNKTEKLNPDVLDRYMDYKIHPDILSTIRLVD